MRAALLAALVAAGGCASDDEASSAEPPAVLRSIAVSSSHACALRQAGLYCWGENFAGELGDGSTEPSDRPVLATVSIDGVVEVAAATGRTCVRRANGTIDCWGDNHQGQAGDGTRTDALAPVTAQGIDDAVQLAIDDITTCALKETGDVACWGGSPERAPEKGSLSPQLIRGLSDVVELRGGVIDTYCARDAASEVYCFRYEGGAWTAAEVVPELSGARQIAVSGNDEVCALTAANEAVCYNLTSGNTVPLVGASDLVELIGNTLVACAKSREGDWTCWNILPQLLDMIGSIPIAVPSEVPLIEVAFGGFKVCAAREDGEVVCATAETGGTPEPVVVSDLPR